MHYDPALTTQQNLVKLVNTGALIDFQDGDLSFSDASTVVPSSGNGMKNTQVTVSSATLLGPQGSSTVFLNRNTLASIQPKLGTKIFIDNTFTTHQQVQDFICARFGLAAEDLTFTTPAHVPMGGESLNYVLSPLSPNKVYTPGSTLTILVKNTDPLQMVDPTTIFGAPTTTSSNDLVKNNYLFTSTTVGMKTWARYADSDVDNFVHYLNSAMAEPGLLKSEYFTLDTPISNILVGGSASKVGTRGMWASVDFESDGDPFTSGGRFLWLRDNLNTAVFSGIPAPILTMPYATRIMAVMKFLGMPMIGIRFLSQDLANPTRIQYMADPTSLLYYPNTGWFNLTA